MRDVLIENVHSQEELDNVLDQKCYAVPVNMIKDKDLPIHFLALYQPKDDFQSQAGIYYYGLIKKSKFIDEDTEHSGALI